MKMYFVRYNDYKICENGAVYLLFVSNMNITGEIVYETHRDEILSKNMNIEFWNTLNQAQKKFDLTIDIENENLKKLRNEIKNFTDMKQFFKLQDETHRDYFVEGLYGFVSMLHLRSTNVEN